MVEVQIMNMVNNVPSCREGNVGGRGRDVRTWLWLISPYSPTEQICIECTLGFRDIVKGIPFLILLH